MHGSENLDCTDPSNSSNYMRKSHLVVDFQGKGEYFSCKDEREREHCAQDKKPCLSFKKKVGRSECLQKAD